MLVQVQQPRLEAGHAAQHQHMLRIVVGLIPRGPPAFQELQRLVPVACQADLSIWKFATAFVACDGMLLEAQGR